ncbi:MAG: hypothetical protein D6730_25625 [Bacteroidetes bacterium]|nr:MAG: hypothetical protein D6730_25625 [Bacteroidota bacterium]
MKTKQLLWEAAHGWKVYGDDRSLQPQLVLFFGAPDALRSGTGIAALRSMYPEAKLLGCSTAGEIIGDEVLDGSIVATAVEFERTTIRLASLQIRDTSESFDAGTILGDELNRQGLKGVFVLSDGHTVNGSELVKGLSRALGKEVVITGGLAGDGTHFQQTLVACNDEAREGLVVALGLYGEHIRIGHGSVGGWDSFGPERNITKASSNELFELDGQPALELYKKYLGEEAANLPGSALLFPLMIRPTGQAARGTVRTILSIDEQKQSMIFAGDIPEGYVAQLMMANFDRLVDGAAEAAQYARLSDNEFEGDRLAILVSCVGRKMVLGQRVADETEAVQDILGESTSQIGFYSYGEISPHVEIGNCELHNQTMTITFFSEESCTSSS